MELQEIRPLFREEEWRCIRILHEKPQDAPAVRYTAGHMGLKESRLRDNVLSRLIEGGYLMPRTYDFTEAGEEAYRGHRRWWEALMWKLQETGVAPEEALSLADALVCTQTAVPLIQKALEQEGYAQMQAERQVGSELIGETDFLGIIRPGIYKVDYCLLEPARNRKESDVQGDRRQQKQMESAEISELTKLFEPEGRVIIEPITSRLELKWMQEEPVLCGVSCHMDGAEHYEPADDGRIRIYFRAISFEQVAKYRILDGECRIRLHFLQADGTKEEREVRLELPLAYEWSE
ncbi:MAG: hypothetical protein Q4C63_10185 [Eubacteriales bacterium]|nr:hypothetical protein [Eubacteriales bacterium]